jgi:ABC-2 type transport system ATP-binding protein
MTDPSSPAITAVDVHKSFGDNVVLDGLELAVDQGSVFALLGPNGAGKTTMVRILATLLEADHGTIRVAGHDVRREADAVRDAIGVTGQFSAIDELLTGRENLALMADLHPFSRAPARERIDHFIFLDEPTTGLDPRSRRTVWEIVESLVDDGTTVFLTTQYLDEADKLADRVAILDRGRVVAEGSAQELKQQIPGGRIDLNFADAEAQLVAGDALGMPVTDQNSTSLQIPTDGNVATLRRVLRDLDEAGVDVVDLAIHTPDLDDVFFALTGRDAHAAESRTEEGVYR